MTHLSPTTFCTWSVLSCALFMFLVGHLWRYDRFACLKWSNSPYNGAFKRLMTYTYLLSIPMIAVYSVGFAWIKYKEGYMKVIGFGYIPTPYVFWPQSYQNWIFPLMLVLSFSWSLEMITHLEELCFWHFLVTAGPSQNDWFRSRYGKIWMGGSIIALVYVPLIAILNRSSPLKCEARTFLAGSAGDFALTVAFLPILWSFPKFIEKLEGEGVDEGLVVRLRRFYELNIIRVVFRCFMFVPLFILGMDGVIGHAHHVNESLFWTDLLATLAAFGCAFSSVCTILIFFPRSYEAEYRANNNDASPSEAPQSPVSKTNHSYHTDSYHHHHQSTSTQSRLKLKSKSKSTLASMAKELRQTPVKRVLSRIRVRMPGVPQALRRKASQLTIASDVTPFNYPNEPTLERGGSSGSSVARSATKTYLLTDSPILEATTKELSSSNDDDVELLVLDGAGTGGGDVNSSNSSKHAKQRPPRNPNRKGRSYSPPPPRYDPGPSRQLAVSGETWSPKKKGMVMSHELILVEAPHFIDPDAVLSLPQMTYSPSSATASSPQARRDEKKHRAQRPPESYTFTGDRDGSGARQRRSHVPQTPGGSSTTTCTCAASTLSRLTASNLKEHNHRMSKLNPLVLSFSSPLDVAGRNAYPKPAQAVWV